jgi:hypothetical protein
VTRVFQNGETTILALERDLPAAFPIEPETVTAGLPDRFHVYDLRMRRRLGETDRVTLDLDGVAPALLALSRQPPPEVSIAGPRAARPGDNVQFAIRSEGGAAPGILHVEVVDPDGAAVAHYSGNRLAPAGSASELLPLAVNDKTGTWQIRVRDVLSGATAAAELRVAP